jgi:O-antigen/teichoic acid export membrane protein
MAVGVFVSIWVARYLGPDQFGLFMYAQSFVGLFVAMTTLGLDGIVIRELIKDEGKRDKLLGTAFTLKLFGALAMFLLLLLIISMGSNNDVTNFLVLIIASASILHGFNVIDFHFQSKVLSKYIVYTNIFSLLISSFIKVGLVVAKAPLIAFAWVTLFDSFILAIGYLYFYQHQYFSIRTWQFEKPLAISLLKESWPLMFSGIVLMLQARIDQVMLKEIVGSGEVGYYSVALRLIEAAAFVALILKTSLAPSIIGAKEISEHLYYNRLSDFYRLNFIVFLVVATPIFLFGNQVILFLYGSAYESAGVLLSLMAFRLFFTNMGAARSIYILTENLFKFSLITMVVGTITNIVLNYIWIPKYGAKGSIIATIISFFVTTFLLDIFYAKTAKNARLMLLSILTFYKIDFQDE